MRHLKFQRSWPLVAAVILAWSVGSPGVVSAQSETETLVDDGIESGFLAGFDVKLSEVNGGFANFVGLHGGWLINRRFLLGVGGYGMTNRIHEMQMGYGGLLMEYFVNPDKLWNVSIQGLVGGGGVSWNWTDPFFVAAPEVNVFLNIAERWRLRFGGGYRFVGGAPGPDGRLSGVVGNIGLTYGTF